MKGNPFFPLGLRAEMKLSVAGHSQLAWDLSEAFAHHNTSQKCWKQSSAFLLIAGHKALASTSSSGSAPKVKVGLSSPSLVPWLSHVARPSPSCVTTGSQSARCCSALSRSGVLRHSHPMCEMSPTGGQSTPKERKCGCFPPMRSQ